MNAKSAFAELNRCNAQKSARHALNMWSGGIMQSRVALCNYAMPRSLAILSSFLAAHSSLAS